MFSEIFGDIREAFISIHPGPATRTITVSKPYCSPARDVITSTFERYGVKIYSLNERVVSISLRKAIAQRKLDLSAFDGDTRKVLPVAQLAQVTVSEAQAVWAEYLLLRTGKLHVVGEYQNRRNEQWAKQHRGRMPPAWQDGQPWIEKSCKKGVKQWEDLREATRKSG